MRFFQVDVFAGKAYEGNPLAVFPEADGLAKVQMQAIAREMNLSETAFVTGRTSDSYDVRIFTPARELPFAGHPTIGTAWVLRRLGILTEDDATQRSAAGETEVVAHGEMIWFRRSGRAGDDLQARDPCFARRAAGALAIGEAEIELEARELGRSGHLRPALADAGLEPLIVPVRDLESLGRIAPLPDAVAALPGMGVYCFTAAGAGRIRARGFFPEVGILEDPATGSAAAALGLYLDRRIGSIDLNVTQGVEIGRRSLLHVRAGSGRVEIGGRCAFVFEASLSAIP
ncbi:MAG TPA: PhzF family phenazine biosynthesis protein [Actinomycetota bacterium]|nr:PhzF family phenazine biosynthesis protein [Actinomycetota bacterium]